MTNFTLTINTDSIAVLKAVAAAVNNTPPEGFVSSTGNAPVKTDLTPPASLREPDVTIHTREEKVEEAKAAVDAPPEAAVEVKTEEAESAKERGQRLRQLLLAVSKMEGNNIQTAKEIAAKAAGVEPSGIDKSFPATDGALKAIAALEAALAG